MYVPTKTLNLVIGCRKFKKKIAKVFLFGFGYCAKMSEATAEIKNQSYHG